MRKVPPKNSHIFFNRHLSWLQFNLRVLKEALDPRNPLLERVRFLAISASNLDEFVEVRVAGLLQQAEQGRADMGPDGLGAREVLAQLTSAIHDFVDDQYACWREKLVRAGGTIHPRAWFSSTNPTERKAVERFYRGHVEPLLTPVTVDPAHPFPRVLNKALCVAFLLSVATRKPSIPTSAWSRCRARFRESFDSLRSKGRLNLFSCTTSCMPMPRGCITATTFCRPLRFALRATAICISARRNPQHSRFR